MAEEKTVVVTQDRFGRDVIVPIDENGNIILYRATDDPYRIIDSNFKNIKGDAGSVGLGQQSYFSPNPMYSHTYEKPDRKNYKFKTSIKPNEILVMTKKIKDFPELVKALNIPEEFTNMNWWQFMMDDRAQVAMGYEMGTKRFFTENIQVFKDNGIKAFAYSSGTGGQTYIEYEIIPLIKDGDTLDIKPVAILEVEEGLAGKTPDAFIENTIDTPTNVAGAEVIDDIEGIQTETLKKLRNANDAFVAEQVDNIMARKINEVLPFVDTSISRAEAIGISTTGPQITTSADSTLNAFIDDIEKITGQNLDITEKRKLRQFMYDAATNNEYGLLNDAKSFSEGITVNASKLNDTGYKVWKNWQNSGAFREKNITDMTPNEFTAFGPPDYVYLVEGLEKSGESINFTAISDADVNIPDTPTNVVDNKLKRINEILEQGIKATEIDINPTDTTKYGFAPEHSSLIRELEELDLLEELQELVGGEEELGELIKKIAFKQEEVSPRYQTQQFQNFDSEGNPIGKRAYGITTKELQQKEIQDLIKNFVDTPTNVVDDVVITSASENLKQTIPTNADGNIVLYRATTNPNANILSDFTDVNRSNQAGLGQQSFYAIDE